MSKRPAEKEEQQRQPLPLPRYQILTQRLPLPCLLQCLDFLGLSVRALSCLFGGRLIHTCINSDHESSSFISGPIPPRRGLLGAAAPRAA